MRETQIWSLSLKVSLEKEMTIHSSVLAWKIPQTEEPGGLQSMGLQRVGHNWATEHQHLLDNLGLSPHTDIFIWIFSLELVLSIQFVPCTHNPWGKGQRIWPGEKIKLSKHEFANRFLPWGYTCISNAVLPDLLPLDLFFHAYVVVLVHSCLFSHFFN